MCTGWFGNGAGAVVVKAGAEGGYVTHPIFETNSFNGTIQQQLVHLDQTGKLPPDLSKSTN